MTEDRTSQYVIAAIGAAGVVLAGVLAAVITGVFSSSPSPAPSPISDHPPSAATGPPSPTAAATAAPIRCSDNIITCSSPSDIYLKGESKSKAIVQSSHLQVSFKNIRSGSGVALTFTPDLNISGFHFVEIEATSTQEFSFVLEYKVDGQETPVAKSGPRIFLQGASPHTERVPLAFDGNVHVLVLNFFKPHESSTVLIGAIRLLGS